MQPFVREQEVSWRDETMYSNVQYDVYGLLLRSGTAAKRLYV